MALVKAKAWYADPVQLCLISAFVPISLSTPAGFVSLVDLAVFALFSIGVMRAVARARQGNYDFSVIILSVFALFLVVLSQSLSAGAGSFSIILKYTEFLFLIPLGLALNGVASEEYGARADVVSALAVSGTILAIVSLIRILTGHYQGQLGTYYIDFFGTAVNKNGLGAMLIFSLFAAVWASISGRSRWFTLAWIVQYAFIAFIGNRSATLVGAGGILYAYFFASKVSLSRKSVYAAVLLVVSLMFSGAVSLGLFSAQVDRLISLANTDTSNVTASTSRILLWEFGIKKFLEQPMLGWGYGTFSYEGRGWLYGMYEPHDSVIQILYAGGLLGFGAFAILLATGLLRRRTGTGSDFYKFAATGYLLNSLVAIIWVRLDGHLFWIIFFLCALRLTKARGGASSYEVSRRDVPSSGELQVHA